MSFRKICLTLLVLPTAALAQLKPVNCQLIESIAETTYVRANAALQKNWTEAASSAAFFFWHVHDLGECPLSRKMATHMTASGLVRGTEPSGPSATGAISLRTSLTLPSTTRFTQVEGQQTNALLAPEFIVVNGLTYRLQGAGQAASFSREAVEGFLRDPARLQLGTAVIDCSALGQWQGLPISPAVGLAVKP